ncbi:hypothetical protein [Ramlibacter tataouinensis]|uniref:Uncharacterized protein n=1 Tax=Ramlibacter tataouinensis (strain ATCC BAA-407 / DSM 14655 / LMG 21543 / TTB310) TaxID=365046 RepID=F5Y2K0_RAMTT|nr:hypothetical protein [Ramlibacter tataouinensis]AEG92363.1 conserved hypothetical protein [Ramlibacter tataouinensis TTB310]
MSRSAPLALCLAAALFAGGSRAQSFCSSDGQPRPLALMERFINADCDSCWADPATPRPGPRELAIDWVVPGGKGEDAPLAVVASRDALPRLQALGRAVPTAGHTAQHKLVAAARTLRVAHGLPFNDYIGTSIELKPAGRAPWTAWLLLVETLPPGTEGSPVERNLVRNAFQPDWSLRRPPTQAQQKRLMESRPMAIPEGAQAERLRVVGWVEDARGRIRAIAQSRCAPLPAGQ